ncbi:MULTISPECIES: GNAT family N-acetyltransferase [unclassified Rhodococcus (in: high G+C Gram-positive bacteria)]|uniref:GNAT family N-acetyltransferase n=1 Tax=unclassified Rhodococcus (in: high G+C Gram-positive bacteria) TaxID=192944 RepID=UPI00146E1AE6|nr:MULTISPECIES: GNAT family N-acetyltransferase [unclassified Rhodococcus (in: high G+C Gram-positive bacteria)]MBF0661509.1 GNAT family N-acetyltransferase [Rhodococcus sp. (in: high G+C Gram-positive bacteria)]NMD97820.1 GNAT family N-acetyltransferase [Rhodococcus sp. BL-253-APC-6A1W]NME79090.1 GNAT family N-acetyltransferase [Rhodococcus sp. 105337]
MSIVVDNRLSEDELSRVLDFLTGDAYWNRWRSRDRIRQQFESAWKIYAAREPDSGQLLGAVRVSSDGVAYGYIADGFVFPEHRGDGVGSAVLECLLSDIDAADFRWMLHTEDAQPLYSRFGFVAYGPTYMERPSRHSRPASG